MRRGQGPLQRTDNVHSSETVCLAARTGSRSAFLRSVVRFPPVRYCQTSSATAETAFYSRCSRGGKEESYIKQVLNCFDLILLANQGDSPGQPKRSLRAATAIRYHYSVQLVAIKARLDARTEFEILERSLKGSCTPGQSLA